MPAAENSIIISSTDTERQRIQRTGRILRKSKNKAFSTVYYFYMNDTIERAILMYDMPQETKSVELKFYEDKFHNIMTDYAYATILDAVMRKLA